MPDSNDWEVDHLRFGVAASLVPEPGTPLLLGAGLLCLAVRRRANGGPEGPA